MCCYYCWYHLLNSRNYRFLYHLMIKQLYCIYSIVEIIGFFISYTGILTNLLIRNLLLFNYFLYILHKHLHKETYFSKLRPRFVLYQNNTFIHISSITHLDGFTPFRHYQNHNTIPLVESFFKPIPNLTNNII